MNQTTLYPDPIYQHSHPHSRQPPHYRDRGFWPRTPSPAVNRSAPRAVPLRRSYTMDAYGFSHIQQPWEHMAQTYAWVLEQKFAEMALKNDDTVEWVLKQQERDALRGHVPRVFATGTDARDVLEFVDEFAFEVDGCHIFQETWRAAVRWQKDAEKVVQEELRRLKRTRLETERCRMAYERRKADDEARQQKRQEQEREQAKARRDETDRKSWRAYEAQWTAITSSSETPDRLTFRTIPWPMFSPPKTVGDITPARVAMFLLSPLHSEGQSRRDRIRTALRRWHPDRFGRVLARVDDRDKAKVEEGAGIVVRCLNNLLEREDQRGS